MHPDRDFDPERDVPCNEESLVQDLGLDALFEAMARGDAFLRKVARAAVLSSLTDVQAIAYRQEALSDCLQHEAVVRELYAVAVASIDGERKVWRGLFIERHPEAMLHNSLAVLELLLGMLRGLRRIADLQAGPFQSQGFTTLFRMLRQELDDRYFEVVADHLRELRFRHGILISAQLVTGNKGGHYTLRRPGPGQRRWGERIRSAVRSPYSMEISERDEAGHRALAELRDRGLNSVADALAQATDHIVSFFGMLRQELAFYVGCLNLRAELEPRGEPICLPVAVPGERPALRARGLYDACLALRVDRPLVGNDVDADGRSLVMVTGANQGGKSTFLRSVGAAQLMFQCGMFVPAASYSATVCSGLFTHYQREEDDTMRRGKFDEELHRMSDIVDHLSRGGMVLFNESFSGTNEREGSEIARQVIRALLEAGIRVFFVTHFFELAHSLHRQGLPTAVFLRAQRRPDGERTFRVVEGEPLPTSYGEDVYRRVFSDRGAPQGPGAERRRPPTALDRAAGGARPGAPPGPEGRP